MKLAQLKKKKNRWTYSDCYIFRNENVLKINLPNIVSSFGRVWKKNGRHIEKSILTNLKVYLHIFDDIIFGFFFSFSLFSLKEFRSFIQSGNGMDCKRYFSSGKEICCKQKATPFENCFLHLKDSAENSTIWFLSCIFALYDKFSHERHGIYNEIDNVSRCCLNILKHLSHSWLIVSCVHVQNCVCFLCEVNGKRRHTAIRIIHVEFFENDEYIIYMLT